MLDTHLPPATHSPLTLTLSLPTQSTQTTATTLNVSPFSLTASTLTTRGKGRGQTSQTQSNSLLPASVQSPAVPADRSQCSTYPRYWPTSSLATCVGTGAERQDGGLTQPTAPGLQRGSTLSALGALHARAQEERVEMSQVRPPGSPLGPSVSQLPFPLVAWLRRPYSREDYGLLRSLLNEIEADPLGPRGCRT